MPIRIDHPKSQQEFESRNEMLQSCLREQPFDIPIEHDYPLTLSRANPYSSFCVFDGHRALAHVNAQNRTVLHHGRVVFEVMLIGNVATRPEFRGMGYAQLLLSHIENIARANHMAALLLWNDIPSFYSRLGFQPFGKECRLTFKLHTSNPNGLFKRHSPDMLNHTLIERLQKIHQKREFQLERSQGQWFALLSIPQTYLFTHSKGDIITSYFVFGRGSDMRNVIHEWYFESDHLFEHILSAVGSVATFTEVMMLLPNKDFNHTRSLQDLAKKCLHQTIEPMCWLKPLRELPSNFEEDFYVWGLDSI